MARIDHWPRKLTAFVEERRASPFVWGAHDCCMFVVDWVALLTGIDPAPELRGAYTTEKGAAKIIKKRGGDVVALADEVCARHGWPRVGPKLARRGDVVAHTTPTGPCLGICLGAETVCAGAGGLVTLPTESGLAAWRID